MSTNKRALIPLIFLLLFCLVQSVNPVTSAQQQSSRERKVHAAALASPTPTPTPSTSPITSPVASPAPTPQASPTPKIATTTQTLAELQARISEIRQKPELAQAMVGIKVASL